MKSRAVNNATFGYKLSHIFIYFIFLLKYILKIWRTFENKQAFDLALFAIFIHCYAGFSFRKLASVGKDILFCNFWQALARIANVYGFQHWPIQRIQHTILRVYFGFFR